MAEKKKKNTEEKPPNIVFVGKQNRFNGEKGKYESLPRKAPAFVIDAGEKIALPDGIEKGARVSADVKARLLELFPNDFKEIIAKGENR